jgi:phenylalanyl-tRNA synthetase beta chain
VVSAAAPAGLRGIELEVRGTFRAAGLNEMITLSMVDADDNRSFPGLQGSDVGTATLANPMSSETGEMRRSLIPGLLHALAENRRQGEPVVAGFVCGRVYGRRGNAYVEQTNAAVLIAGTWPPATIGEAARPSTFADVKGRLEAMLEALHVSDVRWEAAGEGIAHLHLGKAARIVIGGETLGVAGGLHPDLIERRGLDVEPWVAELDLQKLLHYCPRRVILRPLPRFPAVQRDVAVIVDSGFQAQQVLEAIGEVAQPLVEEVRVFDQYTGDPIPAGKKSLAYSVSYRAPDRTLTDDEVNALHEELVGHLVRRLSVEVRR